ncbi:MAG: DUF58 domain-containing protein [Clostridia bacterium]|nr:DUF58 domain-containing protein [Clostridia bacterium]
MARYRILYLDILILAVALFAAFEAYAFHLLLIALLILPVLSLLLTLPLRRRIYCSLSVEDDMVPKGDTPLELNIRNESMLPCLNGQVRITCSNAFGRSVNVPPSSGEAAADFAIGGKKSARLPITIRFDECGRIDFGLRHVYVYDILGLFRFQVPGQNCQCDTDSLYVFPDTVDCLVETENSSDLGIESSTYSTERAGNDPSEIFDLRDYVPGDAHHSIHWKLSGRMNRLIVKEYGLPLSPLVHFLVEIREKASPEEKESVMGTLMSVSETLVSRDVLHHISWIGEDSVFHTVRVSDTESLAAALHEMLGMPASSPYETIRNLAMQAPFSTELHLVYMIGGTASAKELNGEEKEIFSMLMDSNLCRRITVMPVGCDESYPREIRELGCDLQMVSGEVPEEEGGIGNA